MYREQVENTKERGIRRRLVGEEQGNGDMTAETGI